MRAGNDLKVRLGPSGVHLFHRKSGLNVLLDEVRPSRESWAAAPRHISIALTNSCDLECAYCFAPKTRASLRLNDVLQWVAELDAGGTLGVGFGGGEPTLYRHFGDLCSQIAENSSLAVTFTTHGHHLNDRLLERLRNKVNFVRVSMDGVGKTYERLRGRSFTHLRQRLAAISAALPFGINYVVNADTLSDIDAAIGLANEFKAAEFLLLARIAASLEDVSLSIK